MNFAFEIHFRHVIDFSGYAIPYSKVTIYFVCLIKFHERALDMR